MFIPYVWPEIPPATTSGYFQTYGLLSLLVGPGWVLFMLLKLIPDPPNVVAAMKRKATEIKLAYLIIGVLILSNIVTTAVFLVEHLQLQNCVLTK
jgi:hypothetical protein